MKVDLETVKNTLVRKNVPPERVTDILNRIREIEESTKEEKPPAKKKQFCILVAESDSDDKVGWVVRIPEEESTTTVLERVRKAAYDFNASPRGRKLPVATIGEALENVSAKFFKEYELSVNTKEPVLVQFVSNELPVEQSE